MQRHNHALEPTAGIAWCCFARVAAAAQRDRYADDRNIG
jgi:hypothetical protein